MTAALIVGAAFIAFYAIPRAARSAGMLPSQRRFKRAPTISLLSPAERARILATSVEELAEEIMLRREMEAPGYVAPPCGCYLCEKRRMPAVLPVHGPIWCAIDACGGAMYSSPNTAESICGRCGRAVRWEELRA